MQQGPCLDAVYERETARVADLAGEPRWPGFTARVCAAGAAGMLSIQLYVGGDNLGALNMFCHRAWCLGVDDESEHVGLLFASHAAIAYAAAQQQAKMVGTPCDTPAHGRADASSWSATRSLATRRSRCWSGPADTAT